VRAYRSAGGQSKFLASNRLASLSRRAAVENVIDFGKARLLDPAWHRHKHERLRAMARILDERVAAIDLQSFALLAPMIKLDERKAFVDMFLSRRDSLIDSLTPWGKKARKAQARQIATTAKQEYNRAFGVDVDSQEFIKYTEDWKTKQKAGEFDAAPDEDQLALQQLADAYAAKRP
jgi:hypothetical protein